MKIPPTNWLQLSLNKIDNSEICRFDLGPEIKNPNFGKRHVVAYYPYDAIEDKKLKKKYSVELGLYDQHPLYYFINEQGFRSRENYDELYDAQVDIILGCSFTWGWGFHEETTWPYILRELERSSHNNIINLSVPGTGTDTAFRLFLTHLKRYKKIRRVIHYQPYYNRHELINDQIAHTSLGHCGIKNDIFRRHFTDHHLKTEFIDERSTAVRHIKNISAIKALCDKNNIPYYFNSGVDMKGNRIIKEEIFARDIHHGGFTGQFSIAEQFYSQIKNKDTDINFRVEYDNTFDNTDKVFVPSTLNVEAFRYYAKNNSSVSKFYPNPLFNSNKVT